MKLKNIINEIRQYDGLTRKRGIKKITSVLQEVSNFGASSAGLEDDAAVIKDGEDYLLFATDGIWKKMIESDPYAAGRASIIVNVNDIYAMGGKPIAMVNVISATKEYNIDELLKGIKDGCALYQVPMVGGHFHPDSDSVELSVAVLGKAKKLLTSYNAIPEQDIIAAIDLDGKRAGSQAFNWNSIYNKTTDQVLERLELMVLVAETGLCNTAKDISNPGIIGTLAMLMEASKKGAIINLQDIPKPEGIDLTDWLKIYPAYGFILCADKSKSNEITRLFNDKGITANVIGNVTGNNKIYLSLNDEKEIFFDLEKESIF